MNTRKLGVIFWLLLSSPVFANEPAIYDILLDATGSMGPQDFRKANDAAAALAETLHRKSQINPGDRADWISVNYFGGPEDYKGTKFMNCSNDTDINRLTSMLRAAKHPKYGSTAIYSAIKNAVFETLQRDNSLPGGYINNIIVVTDGQNNSSPQDVKDDVNRSFPNNRVNLFVIGVGSESQVKEFQGVADHISEIENFDALAAALLLTSQVLR